VLILRPVDDDSVWWEVARGRVVMAELSLTPSADLLIDDDRAESDWLGGLPIFVSFAAAGFSGIMGVKVIAAAAACWLLLRDCKQTSAVQFLVTGLAIFVAFGHWRSAASWDALGALSLVCCLRHQGADREWRWLAVLFVLQLGWAQFGPRAVVGPLLAWLVLLKPDEGARKLNWRSATRVSLLLLLACCLTPRGVWGPWDAIRLTCPLAFDAAPLGAVNDTATLWMSASVFLALGCFALTQSTALGRAGTIVLICLGCTEPANLPWCALVVAAAILRPSAAHAEASLTPERREMRWCAGAALGLLAALAAIGKLPGDERTAGWGLTPQLEIRLVEAAVDRPPPDSTPIAYCADLASAGAAVFCGFAPTDTPQRAWLGRRTQRRARLYDDLISEERDRYRRADGSWGGWWLELNSVDRAPCAAVFVSATDTRLIRALESSIFKPSSVDAPVIPYLSTAEPRNARRIIDTVGLRSVLDRGEWVYRTPQSLGLYSDLASMVGAGRRKLDLRQARVFLAMEMPTAALRVLRARRGSDNRVVDELADAHAQLAYREMLAAGRASRWRTGILASLKTDEPEAVWRDVLQVSAISPNDPRARAIDLYLLGRDEEALRLLKRQRATAFARAQLVLETGDSESAKRLLRDDINQPLNRDALESIP
jgi:hypothetical protein